MSVANGEHWFADQCLLLDETALSTEISLSPYTGSKLFAPSAMDGGREASPGSILPAPVETLGMAPSNPGFLYASIDGGRQQRPDPMALSSSGGENIYNYLFWGSALGWTGDPSNPNPNRTSSWTTIVPALALLRAPLWGTCLGLSQAELDGIPADGSAVLDWKTLYIFDAVLLIAKYTGLFLSSRTDPQGPAPYGPSYFTSNDDFVAKLKAYFASVIPDNRASGRSVTVTNTLPLTGNVSFSAGIASEDNFLLGDRVQGFPFALRNFRLDDSGAVSYAPVGYLDPQVRPNLHTLTNLSGRRPNLTWPPMPHAPLAGLNLSPAISPPPAYP